MRLKTDFPTRNNVRGVQAPGQPWVIADFKAEVMVNGRIRADGRGLVFAGGNTIGTALVVTPTGGTAGLKVFATLICENVPNFVQRNTNLAGVPLAANGDFKIDDMLSPPPLPRSSCATPVLLIRSTAGNLTWFAAGIKVLHPREPIEDAFSLHCRGSVHLRRNNCRSIFPCRARKGARATG
jgi:hypothetical protein